MLQQSVNLQPFNTLNVKANAQYFASVSSVDELLQILAAKDLACPGLPLLVVGGGSNLVLKGDCSGLVILNRIMHIEKIKESDRYVTVKVGAGQNWDEFVAFSLSQGWYGLENLSAIPGTVGAAPIQNIGAYGVELKHFLQVVDVVDVESQVKSQLTVDQCQLGYRDSIFKRELKGRKVICSVTLQLLKQPDLKLDYSDIPKRISTLNIKRDQLTARQLRELIISIRSEKLPDPKQLPNVGSFFKNPVVSKEQYSRLQRQYPELIAFALNDGSFKLAAGWMIDNLGWKGKQKGEAAVHKKQALVLINQGCQSRDLLELASDIQNDVYQRFNIWLEPEPTIL